MKRTSTLLIVALLAVQPMAARAQSSASVTRRMDAFVASFGRAPEPPGFFPREGALEWVVTYRTPGEADRVERQRFAAEEIPAALDGPLCRTFTLGADMAPINTLSHMIRRERVRWRLVGESRFVPRDSAADSPLFVQWRRESGTWVIAAIGEEVQLPGVGARILGVVAATLVRDSVPSAPVTFPIPSRTYADSAWLRENPGLVVAGEMLSIYGLPRPIQQGGVQRIGTVRGLPVYAEAGAPWPHPIVYLPLGPSGPFQVYQQMMSDGC